MFCRNTDRRRVSLPSECARGPPDDSSDEIRCHMFHIGTASPSNKIRHDEIVHDRPGFSGE